MMRSTLLAAAFLLLTVPVAGAQLPADQSPLYQIDLNYDTDPVFVPFGGQAVVDVQLIDRSRDSTGGAGAEAGAPNVYGIFHTTRFDATMRGAGEDSDLRGWFVDGIATPATRGGMEETVSIRVFAGRQVQVHSVLVDVTATTETRDGPIVQNFTLEFFTDGIDGFAAGLRQGVDSLAPSEFAQAAIFITNPSLFPATYSAEVTGNPCDLPVVAPASATLAPKESNHEIFFTVGGPEDRFWYFSEDCSIEVSVFPIEDPNQAKRIPIGVVVNGGYLDPQTVFYVLAAAVAMLLLAFFLARRKAAIEEELLGKPQRPWTIPVERVYLEHLQERDPRAAYVVRHFLMEEEYQSSLLWYKSYKHATRGTRAKERIVVAQEKRYGRFRAKWQKRIARPQKTADRLEAKLQKRLDRRGKAGVRRQRRTWKKQVAKLEKAFEAKHEKAVKKWEKAARKAEKKGEPVPAKPAMGSPDLPPEPSLQRIMLADHKWDKKAKRFRRKMVRREGNLEVRFEKRDARMLQKVERKVHRIAQKLDDPEFAAEHPLVGKQAG